LSKWSAEFLDDDVGVVFFLFQWGLIPNQLDEMQVCGPLKHCLSSEAAIGFRRLFRKRTKSDLRVTL